MRHVALSRLEHKATARSQLISKARCTPRKSDAWNFCAGQEDVHGHFRVWLRLGPKYGAESAHQERDRNGSRQRTS
jgi:hypothetical protein